MLFTDCRLKDGDQVHLLHIIAPRQMAVMSGGGGVVELNEAETKRRTVSQSE